MHLHGGGYLFGTLSSEDAICAGPAIRTAAQMPTVVLNLNYRHTLEYVYPTAWLDVQDALAWIHAVALPEYGIDPARVVVGGISTGANLAAALVLEQHLGRLPQQQQQQQQQLPVISGQVLMSPSLVRGAGALRRNHVDDHTRGLDVMLDVAVFICSLIGDTRLLEVQL